MMDVAVKLHIINSKATPPIYMSEGASGCDVSACIEEPLLLLPGQRTLVTTGLKIEIPTGYEIQVRPRSGLALKSGLTVINSPGTIDSDYRGELKILLVNLGSDSVTVRQGDRIAQLVLQRVEKINWLVVDELDLTGRKDGGFGSTGC